MQIKNRKSAMRRNTWRLIVLLSATILVGPFGCRFLGAPASTPLPSPTFTLTATTTETPSPSPSPTISPSLTAAPSRTPFPTFTQTPLPTETPRGFNRYVDMGMSFTRPRNLGIERENESSVVLQDSSGDVFLEIYTFLESTERPLEDWVEEIIAAYDAEMVPGSLKIGQVSLADGVQAPAARAWFNYYGRRFALQLVYAFRQYRSYLFVVTTQATGSEDKLDGLNTFYKTVSLFMPGNYGLEHEQTLVQTGYEPEASDLDPARTTSGAAGYLGLLYSGLVRLSPDLMVAPDLAESWTVSPDGLVYTFHLRPEARFASGKPITAQDFKDSWERAVDPGTESPTAGAYLGDIVGVTDRLEGKAENIAGVQVIDERTLQVTIDAPKPYFLAKLAAPVAFVLDVIREENAGREWMFDPNASGPYRVRKFDRMGGVAFERNPFYYSPPAIPYLVYLFYGGGSLLDFYRAGYLDIMDVRNADVAQVRQPEDPLNADYHSIPAMCTSLLQFSNSQPPMDDINVRKAFALSVDKVALVERLTGNIDLLAQTILPPGMPGFSLEPIVNGYNPEAARAALAESSYAGNLPPVVLNAVGYGDSNRSDVSALVDMWRKDLGVEVQVEYLDPAGYAQAAHQEHGQMVLFDWCADYPDPENFLDFLFQSQSVFNVTEYSNPAIDAMLNQAGAQYDPNLRLEAYRVIERKLLEDFASLPILHPVLNVLVKPRVKGFVLLPIQTVLAPWLYLENVPYQP